MASLLILVAPATAEDDQALAQTDEQLDTGRQVFEQNCQACHQAGGAGLAGTFPPLAGNPAAEDPAYVREVVTNGRTGEIEVQGVTYNAEMPAIALDDGQLDAVVAYVVSIAGRAVEAPAGPPAGPEAGDAAAGEARVARAARLANGGPGCFACHQAGTFSNTGAGLGPDLTDAVARLGGSAGLSGWLAAPPSPTMQPLFADRPLTETEIADLSAYLSSVAGTESGGGLDPLLLGGLGGLAALFVFMALVLRGPRGTYVDRLRSRA